MKVYFETNISGMTKNNKKKAKKNVSQAKRNEETNTNSNSSPVCFAHTDEVRDEYK